jgi:SAM-dependent methyltransferase
MAGDDAPPHVPDPFDPGTYGRSFADVYDEWYPDEVDTEAAVRSLVTRCDHGTGLELGVGTGRLALALEAAGCRVTGLDASPEMLDALRRKDPDGRVATVLGDVADGSTWPDGGVDLVLAANNLLCNLASADEQRSCVERSAGALRPGGHLVVECFIPAPVDTRTRTLSVRDVTTAGVRLIATDARPGDGGPVTGAHVELRDGEPPRVRPWRIVPLAVATLDAWSEGAGLRLVDRSGGWAGEPFDPLGARHVSTYLRPMDDGGRPESDPDGG